MSKQLLRSGAAIGALVRETAHVMSKADFIHKMAVAQKEAAEIDYWIELLYQSEYLEGKLYLSFIKEINKIFSSIIITSKERKKCRKINHNLPFTIN